MRWKVSIAMLSLSVVMTLPGCAIYDPYQVWRFNFDYNTERALSVQWTGYDHLPPKTVRMRLQKWAYNPGPSPAAGSIVIPAGSPVEPMVLPPVGVLPGGAPDLLEQSQPPALPANESLLPAPIPGIPAQQLVEPYGPTARVPRGAATTSRSATTASSSSWLFSTR